MITGHGNNIYQFCDSQIEVDFSSNIAFNNLSGEICQYLCNNIDSIANYPDPEARKLTEIIANEHSVSPTRVIVTNGSAEAFYLVAHLFARRGLTNTAITIPSFSEYEDSCRLYNHEISYIAINELLTSDLSDLSTLWLGSPNNPDGYRITMAEIRHLAHNYPSCYFVVDRAYNELSEDEDMDDTTPHNIIIINSFTKAYGIPGLRLGYLVANEDIVAELSTMRPPWSVNSLSLIAGEYIVKNRSRLRPAISELIGESKYLQESIAQIDGFVVTPSKCNFFLVEITNGKDASELQEYLVNNYGLLIRNASNFRGATERHIRIAAQHREANNRLIEALQKWR